MKQTVLTIKTSARTQLIDITAAVQSAVAASPCEQGICTVFIPHTTAGVTINENADPDVRSDIQSALEKLIPWEGGFAHAEGNSAAHIKASLFGFSQIIMVEAKRLRLGTWQGIYFAEFDGPRQRKIWVTVISG